MKKNLVNFFAKVALALSVVSVVFIASFSKSSFPFKPVVYNFEAYISDFGRDVINKDFNYREFGDVSEFTKAIEDNRTIAGVGSDFQIARLAQKGLLQKIDYSKLFPNWQLTKVFQKPQNYESFSLAQKQEFINKKRAAFEEMFRPEIVEHVDKYDQFMKDAYDSQKNLDTDNDGIQDRFWEFFIPYYTQDKVIAYTIGDYDVDGKRKNLRKFQGNWTAEQKEQIQEKGLKFEDQSLSGIGKTLRKNGYSFFEWTEAMRDNLLIGAEKTNQYGQVLTENNYKSFVDGFIDYIGEISGFDYFNLRHNVLKTSGLDLANSVIDPSLNQDVGFLYNGDSLDAHYSKDNYEELEEENTIAIIRPKNNLTLLDGWIILKDTSPELTDKIYNSLYEGIYKGEDFDLEEIVQKAKVEVDFAFVQNSETEKFEPKKGKGFYFDYESIPFLANFDYINYTPTFKKSFEFFKKFYFNDAVETVRETLDGEDRSVFVDLNDEIIDDGKNLNYNNIKSETSSNRSLRALNMYLSQQPEQTLYGNIPTENNTDEGRYQINYTFLMPLDERLASQIRTYYNLKTKN
ncbi:type 2 periplasmic-binding domain-containing protein [Mesomycoplasma ovipneumoniae]